MMSVVKSEQKKNVKKKVNERNETIFMKKCNKFKKGCFPLLSELYIYKVYSFHFYVCIDICVCVVLLCVIKLLFCL